MRPRTIVPSRNGVIGATPAWTPSRLSLRCDPMARLVFDIETSALDLQQFDEAQQEYLFRDAERLPDPDDRARRRAEISQMFSLWPFTAQVVCIAMVNADTGRGQVLFQSDDFEEESGEAGGGPVEFAPQPDEGEIQFAIVVEVRT